MASTRVAQPPAYPRPFLPSQSRFLYARYRCAQRALGDQLREHALVAQRLQYLRDRTDAHDGAFGLGVLPRGWLNMCVELGGEKRAWEADIHRSKRRLRYIWRIMPRNQRILIMSSGTPGMYDIPIVARPLVAQRATG